MWLEDVRESTARGVAAIWACLVNGYFGTPRISQVPGCPSVCPSTDPYSCQ